MSRLFYVIPTNEMHLLNPLIYLIQPFKKRDNLTYKNVVDVVALRYYFCLPYLLA